MNTQMFIRIFGKILMYERPKNQMIIAPHVDDEVIGCYSLLAAGNIEKVIYITDFEELTTDREAEALAASKMFGFTPIFCTLDTVHHHTRLNSVLYIPNINDNHPHHKAVNKYIRSRRGFGGSDLIYYSIDMNRSPTLLSPEDRASKLNALQKLYPSQSALFESDAKYYLFESIEPEDGHYTVDLHTTTSVERVTITYDGRPIDELTEELHAAILGLRPTKFEDVVRLCHVLYPNTKVLNIRYYNGLNYTWSSNA